MYRWCSRGCRRGVEFTVRRVVRHQKVGSGWKCLPAGGGHLFRLQRARVFYPWQCREIVEPSSKVRTVVAKAVLLPSGPYPEKSARTAAWLWVRGHGVSLPIRQQSNARPA